MLAILDVAHAFALTHSPSSDAEWQETARRLAQAGGRRRGRASSSSALAQDDPPTVGVHHPSAAESRNSYLGGDC